MPSTTLAADKLCVALKNDGHRCSAPRRTGKDYCLFHDPDRRVQKQPDPKPVVPSLSLDQLAALDFSLPANISVLRKGLIQHVMAGSLLANAAAQVLRFAEAEAAAAPKRKTSTALDVLTELSKEKPALEEE